MSVLTDELEDLENDLKSAKDTVGNNPGPLSEPGRSSVAGLLGTARSSIANVIEMIGVDEDPTASLPTTLPDIAALCVTLAEEARRESEKPNPEVEYIGERMASIDWLITTANGYRDKAGIT